MRSLDTFKPMLACNDELDLTKVVYPVIAQPKFDGIRCTILPGLGPVSRTLKPIPNDFIRGKLAVSPLRPGALHSDGEIVTYTDGRPDELNTVQSKVMSKDGEPVFTYHVFDHVERPDDPYEKRWARIAFGDKCPLLVIDDEAALLEYEDKMVAAGWEGVILRKPGAVYKFGRSTMREGILLKMKRFHDAEARVIGFVEGTTNTNEQTRDALGHAKRSKAKAGMIPADTLGALKMKMLDSEVEFEIGSGFDDALKKKIWHNQADYVLKLVTYKFQRLGPHGRPLLPVFKAFRSEYDFG